MALMLRVRLPATQTSIATRVVQHHQAILYMQKRTLRIEQRKSIIFLGQDLFPFVCGKYEIPYYSHCGGGKTERKL